MPPYQTPYTSRPFVYDLYDNQRATERLTDLIGRRGEIGAQAALRKGEISNRMWQDVGSNVSQSLAELGAYPEQRRQEQRAEREMALRENAGKLVTQQVAAGERAVASEAALNERMTPSAPGRPIDFDALFADPRIPADAKEGAMKFQTYLSSADTAQKKAALEMDEATAGIFGRIAEEAGSADEANVALMLAVSKLPWLEDKASEWMQRVAAAPGDWKAIQKRMLTEPQRARRATEALRQATLDATIYERGRAAERSTVDDTRQQQQATESARHNRAMENKPAGAATVVIQTPEGPKLLDKSTATTRDITSPVGETLPLMPTADMRNRVSARNLALQSVGAIKKLGDEIIVSVGPKQRLEALARGADAVFGADPKFRAYQDARKSLAGNLAVAQQGSRPSDVDILAIWLPMVPDPYRDTKESAAIKWDLINTMTKPTSSSSKSKVNPFLK